MAAEGEQLATAFQVPDNNGFVAAARGKTLAIRTEYQVRHNSAMSPQASAFPTGLGLPHAYAVVALLGACLFALGDASPYAKRLETILDPDNSGYGIRAEVWRDSLKAWRAHPVFGTGPNR